MSLVARHIEAHGIPTVCVGSALDILQAGRPPRACFVDYPLGHSAGRPFDLADQDGIVTAALDTLVAARGPDTLVSLPNRWGDEAWRRDASSTDAQDTRQPRDDTPQFQFPADRVAAVASGAWRE